jgi:plastocyanin domain-containing protein
MEMNSDILTLVLGSLGMISTYWFFLMRKDQKVVASNEIDISVSGGYKPSSIEIQKDQPTKFNFIRTDASDCLEEVVLSDFKIKKFLPLDKKVSIEITPTKKGEYFFSCGMNMYHGKIIVS